MQLFFAFLVAKQCVESHAVLCYTSRKIFALAVLKVVKDRHLYFLQFNRI